MGWLSGFTECIYRTRWAWSRGRETEDVEGRKSLLSEIPGIGPKRKKTLLMHFGSVIYISEASLSELNKIKGISNNSAEEIINYFNSIKN